MFRAREPAETSRSSRDVDGDADGSSDDGGSNSDSNSDGDYGRLDVVCRESAVEHDVFVDTPTPPAADLEMPGDGPEVPAAEPADPGVPAGDPVSLAMGLKCLTLSRSVSRQ